jgi:hypothetical protein
VLAADHDIDWLHAGGDAPDSRGKGARGATKGRAISIDAASRPSTSIRRARRRARSISPVPAWERLSRGTPRSDSSRAIRLDTACWVMPKRSAASVKCLSACRSISDHVRRLLWPASPGCWAWNSGRRGAPQMPCIEVQVLRAWHLRPVFELPHRDGRGEQLAHVAAFGCRQSKQLRDIAAALTRNRPGRGGWPWGGRRARSGIPGSCL